LRIVFVNQGVESVFERNRWIDERNTTRQETLHWFGSAERGLGRLSVVIFVGKRHPFSFVTLQTQESLMNQISPTNLFCCFRLRMIALPLAMLSTACVADMVVPTADLKGLTDPPGIKRYAGSVLVYRDDVAYDEVKFPSGKVRDPDEAFSSLATSGKRVTLQYTLPAARSPLEVIRNYQSQAKAEGFQSVFECAGDACGSGSGQIKTSIVKSILPSRFFDQVGEQSAAACGAYYVSPIRYALMENKSTGVVIGVAAASPEISSAYCSDAYKNQLTVWVTRVEPQAREQQMVAISASEMAKSIDASGRIALYGIFFDTGKADVKPESKASLDQIAELMKSRSDLKLHVVGHTDNVGVMDANMSLSKRRAESVVTALATNYNVYRARLTGNGVASLAPVQTNSTETGRAKNRRVELVLQ
jgi:OmpA-OmpF porin, OOP family